MELPREATPVLGTEVTATAPPPPSTFPSLLPQPCPTGHLHHVHQVTETHSLINGEVPVSMQDTIVDDITAKTDTQDIVSRVTG